ncbi:hypothetical protein Glove_194g177 [Diversispora epigaea]|uniref:Uncharacterized protein n=1 Tax=Diversispora epigaea TaxID=1348612 RepID=A0A397IVL5_9GLOM|nr:hypothetical protein Glove_194g177 [Diversispora epigaea]
MQKNSLILILIIAIFCNFILAAVPFKLRKSELLKGKCGCPIDVAKMDVVCQPKEARL